MAKGWIPAYAGMTGKAGMTIKKITKKLDIRVFVGIMAFVGGRSHWHNTRGKDMTQTNQTNLTANAVAVESAIGNRQSAIGNRQSAIGNTPPVPDFLRRPAHIR